MLGRGLGGLEQVALDYHINLEQRGHQVLTILRENAKLDISNCKKGSVTYIEPSKLPFVTSNKIKSLVKSFDGEIVLAHGKRPVKYIKSRRSLKIPRVFIAHNYRSKADCLKMDDCIAVSRPVADFHINLGFKPENCHIIHNMTNMSLVKDNVELQNPPVFGLLSRLHTNKGIDIFLHAFRKLRDQNIIARALIAGSGPEEEMLKSLAKELEISDDIDFIGWISDKQKFYNSIDVFVLPSRVEPFGITIIETMAAGVPMIITDCEGPVSFVRDGKEAYIIEREKINELSGALYTLLEDHHLRADLQYHQSVSAKNFTPQAITEKLEATLNHIIQA